MSVLSALKRVFARTHEHPVQEVAIEPLFAEQRGRRSEVNPLLLAGLYRD